MSYMGKLLTGWRTYRRRSYPTRGLVVCVVLAFNLTIHRPLGAAQESGAEPMTVISYNPVLLPDSAQGKNLALRISVSARGGHLPIVIFSHGAQYLKDDYIPLTEFWAANGFVVIQPTHIESRSLALPKDDPRLAAVWRSRAEDLRHIIDSLDQVARLVPELKGRMDKDRIYAAGHSFGGHTTSLLLGARVNEPGQGGTLLDRRVKGGILMAPPGLAKGFLNVSWDHIDAPMLVIAGNQDLTAGVNDAWEYHADPYFKSPGSGKAVKCLAVLDGMSHYLGGILGTNHTEERHPEPESVKAIQQITLAFFNEKFDKHEEGVFSAYVAGKRPKILSQVECK
ncbi:MAG: alpha/beta fold hydrolase [Rhodospirillaceae bacterium]|nr:alpha/beta fold hydrolase [Rhodospirillaceae bacterium]